MSIITLQVGQCGNQIGEKLFETIVSDCFETPTKWSKRALDVQQLLKSCNQDYIYESKQRFFYENDFDTNEFSKNSQTDNNPQHIARSILIDMESKVVNKLLRKPSDPNFNWKYSEHNSYTRKKGSGNNWSYGYCVNGPKSKEKIMEIVRREVEKCDRLGSFLVCSSLAGGTGSGVGAFCTECLRDEFPRSCIVNPVVWPYTSGEVILQNYNFILTLSKLYEHSDALVLFENDQLHEICNRIDSKKVSFDDLNNLISHKLASLLQPANKNNGSENYLNELITDLCSNPDYKLLTVNNVPQLHSSSVEYSTYQWPALYKQAKQMLITGWFMDEGLNWSMTSQRSKNKTIAASLIARGTVVNFDDGLNNEYFSELNKINSSLYVDWNPCNFSVWNQKRDFNKYSKCLTLLSNSQSPVYKIDALVAKAWKMFTSKAYVHQYVKHGFEEESFLNAFLFIEQLIKRYMNI
jgi:tubulin delta